jgi:hypothetical protein
VDHELSKRLLVGLLAGNVRHVDDLDCHQGGFLLESEKGLPEAKTVIEKDGAGKHLGR